MVIIIQNCHKCKLFTTYSLTFYMQFAFKNYLYVIKIADLYIYAGIYKSAILTIRYREFTISLNFFPLTIKLGNKSNAAQAGDNVTISPLLAVSFASIIAPSNVSAL